MCVYVDGKCVVDLYGTAIGDTDYNADTIQVSLCTDRNTLVNFLQVVTF